MAILATEAQFLSPRNSKMRNTLTLALTSLIFAGCSTPPQCIKEEQIKPMQTHDALDEFTKTKCAAERGSDSAKLKLAVLYLLGDGCDKNIVIAKAMMEELASKGSIDAQYLLGMCLLRGDFGAIDEADGKNRLEYAGLHGCGDAYGFLSSYYIQKLERGDSTESGKLALKYAKQGAEMNSKQAIALLDICIKNGIGCPPQQASQ